MPGGAEQRRDDRRHHGGIKPILWRHAGKRGKGDALGERDRRAEDQEVEARGERQRRADRAAADRVAAVLEQSRDGVGHRLSAAPDPAAR